MIVRLFLGVVLVGSLSGCASTRQPSSTSQLQIRVAHIEKQLDAQDQDLQQLKMNVDDLSDLVGNESAASVRMGTSVSLSQAPVSNALPVETEGILRVAVPTQDVQKALQNAGYYKGNIDGKLGSGSQQAIKDFQKDHQLVSDGIIGQKTWSELQKYQ